MGGGLRGLGGFWLPSPTDSATTRGSVLRCVEGDRGGGAEGVYGGGRTDRERERERERGKRENMRVEGKKETKRYGVGMIE